MGGNRRLVLLLGLVGVLLVVVVAMRWGQEAPVAQGRGRAQPVAQNARAEADPVPADVRLDTLGQMRSEPATDGRNPFRFEARRAPARGPSVPEAPPPTRIPGVPDDQVDAPPPMPAGPPPPPPIDLKFIGIVEKADGTRIAVLSDGKRPISGTEGAEIEGRYKILRIGTESIELSYLDGRGRRTIRMTGQ